MWLVRSLFEAPQLLLAAGEMVMESARERLALAMLNICTVLIVMAGWFSFGATSPGES